MNIELGKRLTKARETRGLSIEEAAHATRLRPSHVQALEEGNLSRFPNAAYAKGFLTMYARYLGVDVTDVARSIETTTQMRVADFQYLSNRSREDGERKREATDTRYDFVIPEKDRSWAPLFVFGGFVFLGIAIFVLWTNMSRIDQTADRREEVAAPPAPGEKKTVEAPQARLEPQPVAASAPEIPRPRVISVPEGVIPTAVAAERTASAEPEIPRARPVSPVANLAVDDAATLANLTPAAPRAIPAKKNAAAGALPAAIAAGTIATGADPGVGTAPAAEEENSAPALDPNTIILEPQRRAWVVIRTGPGGQPIYEDFLYPSAKPMHLPAGRYFIELKEADSVEITRNGRRIAYTAPGVLVE